MQSHQRRRVINGRFRKTVKFKCHGDIGCFTACLFKLLDIPVGAEELGNTIRYKAYGAAYPAGVDCRMNIARRRESTL